jgi:AraC-like DNA-binding protein
MQMKQNKIKFFRVLWSDLSACMTSAFFEYQVYLREEEEGGIDHSIFYHIVDWISVKPRIDPEEEKEMTIACYVKQVKRIMRQSFFVLLKREKTELQVEKYFPWDIHRKGLSTSFVSGFSMEKLSDQASLSVSQFWREFEEEYGDYIDSVLRQCHITVENIQIHNLQSLFRVLNQWWSQPHIEGYFKNHLLDMKALFNLFEFNDYLKLPLASLKTDVLHDLHNLHLQLRDITTGKKINPDIRYRDLSGVFQFTLRDKLQGMLNYYFGDETNAHKRKQVLDAIILPELMDKFEKYALNSQSTCYPVSLKSILIHYNQLFSLPCTEEEYAALMPFSTTLVISNEDSSIFTKEDYTEVISGLSQCIAELPPRRRALSWYQIYQQEEVIQTLKTNLFLIRSHPLELEQEKECYELMMKKSDWSKTISYESPRFSVDWEAVSWNQTFSELDDIDRKLYQLRVLFLEFSPLSYRNTIDLHKIRDILFDSIFTTSILYPSTNISTYKRLLLYFNQYRKSVPIDEIKSQIHAIGEAGTVRDICIVADAHLLSNYDMLTLLKWLYAERKNLTRLVFVSMSDSVPLHCHGTALLNLLQYHEETYIKNNAFRYVDLANEFCSFVDTKMKSITQFSRLSTLQDLLIPHANGKNLKLHLIVRDQSSAAIRCHPFEDLIRENLDLKFTLAYGLTLSRLTLSQLVSHDSITDRRDYSHIYIVRQIDFESMHRNIWYHLLLTVEHLFILTASGVTDMKWLKKKAIQSTVPNTRYTYPFYRGVIQKEKGLIGFGIL